ncbi:hypothetical protein [Novosphingobium sp.]|uniref:hypothetical protein n=1 Tax=Novosphingobium sp. TaxID=1874826 RepID=UPI0026013E0D|nr:hypothetical protein [Novosphingobium sp.]
MTACHPQLDLGTWRNPRRREEPQRHRCAGIGVDNVDIPAASAQGVVVMNTPFGNSITTAEHAIAMMFALARQIPEANAPDSRRACGRERLHGR